jgi:hypothetical protein
MISFAIEQDVYDALIAWKESAGINVSEQLRRAVTAWVQQNAPKELRGGGKKKTKR